VAISRAQTRENVKIALRAIRGQMGRTLITVTIIALGISALVAFNTAAEGLKSTIATEFTFLGSNTFQVKSKNSGFKSHSRGKSLKQYKPFSFRQAMDFKELYEYKAVVSISALGDFMAIVKYNSKKTNPNVQLYGGDANYLKMAGYNIGLGRNFSAQDISLGGNVVVIGSTIAEKLFDTPEEAIEKTLTVGSHKYTVIGVLEEKGSAIGFSKDNICLIPISTLKKRYATDRTNYSINVIVEDVDELDDAISAAEGTLRVVRKDGTGEEDSFEIERSDALATQLDDMMGGVTVAVTTIGIFTLFAAGIGLMNIMLVSVTERTKEIGLRKAIGASAALIKRQFLIEAIVIGQIGGLVGILLGIGLGNLISLQLNSEFTVPWGWILVGVGLSGMTSVISGYYPAKKAANLDAIESLRYE